MASFKARLKLGSTRRWSSSKQMNNANIKNSVTDRNEIESRWVFFFCFHFSIFASKTKNESAPFASPLITEFMLMSSLCKTHTQRERERDRDRERERAKAKRVGTGVVGATHPSYRVLPSFPLSIREAQLFYRVSLVQKGEPVGVYLVLPSFS